MKLHSILAACLVLGVLAVPSFGQDKAETKADASATKQLEALKTKQNNADALNKYFSQQFTKIMAVLGEGKVDKAEATLNDLDAVIKGLKPTDKDAKMMVGRAERSVPYFRKQIKVASTSIEDSKKKLSADPGDVETLELLVLRYQSDISKIVMDSPDKAEAMLKDASDFLAALAEKNEGDKAQAVTKFSRSLKAGLDRQIKSAKKLAAMVGKPAADLNVDGWVNGSPLTNEDVKGKVVLLDFWAVWCGPCIATFPHLREWQEKYGEKDFVIVGVTRYYEFGWDDAKQRAVRKQGTKPEQEDEMLVKFAEHHELKHRFAIQANGELSKYYGVSGIPHVVVIDKQGVVRMVRVGAQPQNAKDIGKLLEELVEG